MVELIWDGKYDEDGRRVAPLRVALPFQTVETVNESAQQRERNLFTFAAQQEEWRNRLIWGDKKYVLPSLLPEFAGKVDLIYIDPPFATGADFSFQAQVGGATFTKEANVIEQKAYRDTWGRGIDSYLSWFYETISILYELLSKTGSIYVHLDEHVGSHAKIILDEIFGQENFRSQITWVRSTNPKGSQHKSNKYSVFTDMILYYAKSEHAELDLLKIRIPLTEYELTEKYYRQDEIGPYYDGPIERSGSMGERPTLVYEYKGYVPSPAGWRVTLGELIEIDKRGDLGWTSNGKPFRKLRPKDDKGQPIGNFWADISLINSQANERLGYPTQKPEALLERIIQASSHEGDLVLDCFCGSGTTAAVTEKLGRRWITCDLGRFAIHTARKRLLGIEGVKPFIVQNLGKYERQVWQRAEFGENAAEVIRQYRRFILDLYHAEPLEGYTWVHGRKGGRMVHVGAVDSPVTPADVQQVAIELRKLGGAGGVDILGWDFALDMNETQKQVAQDARLDVRFVRIPREVLEDKAVRAGDIQFFELAALFADVHTTGRDVVIRLQDFIVARDDVPHEVMSAVKHWSEWIDYWAVDFNYRDDTFHNEWQSYRTRQDRGLQLQVTHPYEQPGTYTIVVKVIDILGNDTTKAFQVEVK